MARVVKAGRRQSGLPVALRASWVIPVYDSDQDGVPAGAPLMPVRRFPLATHGRIMTPDKSSATVISNQQLAGLSGKALDSTRRRANLNVHPELADPVQRMFNAMEPDTYVRPHRHARDNGWELMMVIAGRFGILLFDDTGRVTDRFDLAEDAVRAVEIPPHAWHAVVSLEPGTVMFEVKQGPYAPLADKDFAPWAPVEDHPASQQMRDWYAVARVGEMPPEWRRDN